MKLKPADDGARPEGAREAKRRETYARIAESGLQLFMRHGYDGTTLEMLAEAAGISRRTFFAYFKTKDEVLRAWSLRGWAEFMDELRATSPDEPPLAAVRALMVRRMSKFDDDHLRRVVAVMRSSEGLKAAKQASYDERERTLFATLCEVWRQPSRRPALRLVAMMAIGAMRVAAERWEASEFRVPFARLVQQSFDGIAAAVRDDAPEAAGKPRPRKTS